MLQSPKSLTATIHVRFHYQESEAKAVSEEGMEMLDSLLNQASNLAPDLQMLLLQFVNYMHGLREEGRAEP